VPRRFWKRTKKDIWIIRFVALVISVILWILVMGGKKTALTKIAVLDYQLPPHLMLANQPPTEVTVRVLGPQAFLEEFDRQKRVIPINLTKNTVGDVDIKLESELFKLPLGVQFESASPRVIPIKLGLAIKKRVPVRAVLANRLPDGIRVVSITTRPSTVEIRGPENRLQTIESIKTEPITISPNSLKQDYDVALNIKELPGIQFGDQSNVVSVTVQLEGSLARKWFKKIPVRIKVGDTKLSSKDRRIRVRPGSVDFLLEGPQPILSGFNVDDFDIWAEITEFKSGTIEAHMDWSLPPELRVVQRSADIVEVTIDP
jgi:YbbR domain-containing protein